MSSTFGERLRHERLKKALGVRQLETLAGIPHGVVSRLESRTRAYPSIPVGIRLARVLGVSLDYLAGVYDEELRSTRN
jgi:transcriptional regulator with XRE-family HTH domain